jgi:hypothetical protein
VDEVAIDHGAVLELASETGFTAYDASYLWLASSLGAGPLRRPHLFPARHTIGLAPEAERISIA